MTFPPIIDIFDDFLDVSRPAQQANHGFIQQGHRERQRPRKIDEQYDSLFVRVVPDFMQIGIVEYQASPFFPVGHFFVNPNAAGLLLAGHDEPQVVAKHARIRAAVLGDVLARGQDREKGGFDSGNPFDEARGLRAGAAVVLHLPPVRIQPISLPLVVLRYPLLFRGHLLEVRDALALPQNLPQFVPDRCSSRFDSGDPGKVLRIEECMFTDR